MTLETLRKRRGEIAARMKELVREGITDETREEFDKLEAESKTVIGDIRRLEGLDAEERELAKPAPTNDPPPVIEVGDAPEDRKFETFGEQLRAVATDALGGYRDPRLTEERAVSGHSEGVPADGGFLVQSDFAAGIFKQAHDVGIFLPLCSRMSE